MSSPAEEEEEEEEEEEKKQEEEEEEQNKITGRKIKESCKQGFCVFPGFFLDSYITILDFLFSVFKTLPLVV